MHYVLLHPSMVSPTPIGEESYVICTYKLIKGVVLNCSCNSKKYQYPLDLKLPLDIMNLFNPMICILQGHCTLYSVSTWCILVNS